MRSSSLILSILLHLGVLAFLLYAPVRPPVDLTRPVYQVSLVMGAPGGEALPSPVLGHRPPATAKKADSVEAPKPEALPTPAPEVAAVPKPEALEPPKPEKLPEVKPEPTPEVKPAPAPEPAKPEPKPEPMKAPDPVQIPRAPEPKIEEKKAPEPEKKPEPKPEVKAEPKPEPKPEPPKAPKPEPEKKPEPKPEPKPAPKPEKKEEKKPAPKPKPKKRDALADALADARKQVRGDGSSASRALRDLEKQVARKGVGGGGGEGDGPGGGGIYDVYVAQVILAIQPNWSMPVYSRTNMVVQVRIKLDRQGRVLDCKIEKSSGRPEFDASAINAVERTGMLPPPPTAAQQDLVVSFNSLQMMGR